MTTTATKTYPLLQSRRGGTIHGDGCNSRSLYVYAVAGSEKLTRAEQVAKYGGKLCAICFPEVKDLKSKPAAPKAVEKPAEDNTCPGSRTQDWKFGRPERQNYVVRNGGTCGHCGEWAASTTPYSAVMRKHRIK